MLNFSPMQNEFFRNAKCRWNIKTGATRSGKTFMDLYMIPKRIRAVAGLAGDVVLIGNTKETLQANIIQPLQNIWGANLVSDIGSNNYAQMFGEKVRCIGASKVTAANRLRGSAIKYCYGDEVVTWHPMAFEMLKSRLDRAYSKCDLTCNPEGKLHWFKQFLDSGAKMYCQKYTIDDNPFNDPEFVANLKQEYAGTVYYDRYILGDWVNAEGIVYSMFNEDIHVTTADFDFKPVYYVSCDYGTQNATVFLLWHKIQDGRWLCEKEYYYSGRSEIKQKTDEQYCDDLIKFIDGIKINGMIVDPSAASFIAALRKRGITVIHAKNAVLDGIRFTATLLNKRKILFRPCCKNLIQEFNLYSWKPDTAEDEVIKENDHACDAMRYFCYTHLATSKVGTTNIR
jgi:PBSX family phage terminase large subunit